MISDVLPEHEAGLLVGSRPWPLPATRMQVWCTAADRRNPFSWTRPTMSVDRPQPVLSPGRGTVR